MRKVPELRFDGFDGEWEEKKLKETSKIVGGGTPSTKNKEYWDGDINWFTPSEIDSKRIFSSSERKITEKALSKSSAKLLNKDKTVLFTSRATIGEVGLLEEDSTTNQGFQSLVIKDNFDLNFMYSIAQTLKRKALSLSVGSTFKEISKSSFEDIDVYIPIKEEQEKTGDLFKKIDGLIEIQEGKVSKMEDFKKSMLQKMFPKKGELVPEFRFDGFDGEWSPMFLKDLVWSEYKGRAMVDKLILGGGTEYLNTERLNGGKPILVDNDPDTSFDDILILWDGSKAGAIYTKFEGILGSTLRGFKINDGNDSYFIYSFLKMNENLIEKKYRTPNIPHVVKDFSKVFEIKVPSLEEQEKIGKFFKTLDTQIENEEKLLESYKNMKKSLLQKMFV